MSIVAENIHWPDNPLEYFDVTRSPLSPYNTEPGRDYIYGQLPLFATKLTAAALGQGDYGTLNIVGRRVAALLDILTLGLVFLVALRLLDWLDRRRAVEGALVAAALYALTVTAIQHSHFFTTDSWLTFFGMLTFLLALRSVAGGSESNTRALQPSLVLLGAAFGLTVACKISGALIAVPVFIALLGRAVLVSRHAGRVGAFVNLAATMLIVLASAYVAFRTVSPYTFAHSSWLDVSLNDSFRDALARQAQATSGESLPPPSFQWLLAPRVWSPLENLVVWQLGVPLGIAALAGLGVLVLRSIKTVLARPGRTIEADALVQLTSQLMLVAFVGTVFFYVSTRFAHTGRYLVPMVPLLAVAAACGLAISTRRHRRLWLTLATVLVAATGLYAVAFARIYTRQNTRVAATIWINTHVPGGATIANEHWDDALPVAGQWTEPGTPYGFHGTTVPVFDPDDAMKLRKLYDALSTADYYVLSSPRAWNTIGRLPDRFPLMSRFYEQLFAGKLGFRREATFTSYPELFGVHVDDLRAEEAFWVYDHPPVRIYRRVEPLRWARFKAALCPKPVAPQCG
jgi:hypothetical protein